MAQHEFHLHGRGFAGEGQQAVTAGVAGQIDQDVDAIGADHLRHAPVIQPHRRPPAIGQRAEALGCGVLGQYLGVTGDFKPRPVMVFQ